MNDIIFTLHSWPRAILHIDGDAFFTSCEEAIHPELRGRAIITGGERGIVACASYAAKRMGVKRGVPLWEARRMCPGLVVLPSDYETYSLFSRRMFNVMRRFTPDVEEYSIDEAFADITGMERVLKASYEGIALKVKREIQGELGLTVSVGLSVTKVLAKIGSKHRKPNGLTAIPGRMIAPHLAKLPVEKIWGIGPATTEYLAKLGVRTALEFARLPEEVVLKRFTKPGVEVWRELRGESVLPVCPDPKSAYASISKTKTFAPPSGDAAYVYAHLVRNLESACIKARRYGLAALRILAYLRKNNFDHVGREVRLNRPSVHPLELSGEMRRLFAGMYRSGEIYRATGVILMELVPDAPVQLGLFEDALRAERVQDLYGVVDEVSARYGKHSLHLGASHPIEALGKGTRGEPTAREQTRFLGETRRKRVSVPVVHLRV